MVSNLVVDIAIYNFDLFHYTLLFTLYVGKRIKVSSKTQFQKAPNMSQEVTSHFMCSIRPVVKLAAWILGESGALKLHSCYFLHIALCFKL